MENPAECDFDNPEIENTHVNDVYNQIAEHFSHTRYKAWPLVEKFLLEIKEGSLVADVGCGNGKYMKINPKIKMIGSDRSRELVKICKERGFEVLVSDNLGLSFRTNTFDAAISIAVIHHFSDEERRLKAIRELVRICKVGGTILITVWAFEQKNKKYTEQDNLIPWKMQKNFDSTLEQDKIYLRYYHLWIKDELEDLAKQIKNVEIIESNEDHENWYLIIKKIADQE